MELGSASYHPSTASRQVCIVGTGAVTAVGVNAPMTAASVRAGLIRFSESYMIDKAGEPMLLSMVSFIEESLRGLDRMLALAVPAAEEALAPLAKAGFPPDRLSSIPVWLGLPASRPGWEAEMGVHVLPRLEGELGISFSRSERYVSTAGHAAGLAGIARALELLRARKADMMLVGGVDSYYHPDTLEWLDEGGRLHSEENMDGFVPGEGAGFCLLMAAEAAKRLGIEPLALIRSAVIGQEPHPLTSDGICIGEGLTQTLHKTLAVLGESERADWTICDMNGESFRGMEWLYAYLRSGNKHSDPLEIWHPADCYGDIGAASGSLLTGIGLEAWQRHYARGPRCLTWTSSDGEQRAALLLQYAFSHDDRRSI